MISRNPPDSVRDLREVQDILQRIPILIYHKVEARKEVGINVVPPEKFRRHIALLRALGYQSVTFWDLLAAPALPAKPVILTFDDAYESIYHYAFPVLQEFGFSGVAFVIAGFIGRLNRWDVNLGGFRFRHMTEEQLREIEQAGWEIGSHGVSHCTLTFPGREQLRREICDSRRILQKISAKPLVSIAYPFAMHNHRVRETAKEAGFIFGCKSIRGGEERGDLLQIRRTPVYQFEGTAALAHKLEPQRIPLFHKIKLSVLSGPALLTPFYQALFKRQLFLEK